MARANVIAISAIVAALGSACRRQSGWYTITIIQTIILGSMVQCPCACQASQEAERKKNNLTTRHYTQPCTECTYNPTPTVHTTGHNHTPYQYTQPQTNDITRLTCTLRIGGKRGISLVRSVAAWYV